MIQLNLLPDVKLEYLKAQRARRLVVSISFIVSAAAVTVLVLLLIVDLAQKKQISDLTSNINKANSTLESKPDIGKILTIQNQLQSLTTLHEGKPAAVRLVSTYLNQITPVTAAITDLNIAFAENSGTITGTADSLATVNKYVDTLKFTTFQTSSKSASLDAFSNVVLSSFSVNATSTGNNDEVDFSITFDYNPVIFYVTDTITLNVPNLVTTRSELDQPGPDLFKAKSTKSSVNSSSSSNSSSSASGGQ